MSDDVPFGARLHAAMAARGPLCVGIDPHAALLHDWGLPDDVSGLERFALSAVEALAPVCAAIKPQSAFFERFGSRGVAVLEQVIATCREAGTLVVVDAKRGDIGSTTQAYADAYLDPSSPLAGDCLTVTPYLGFGSMAPFFETATRHGKGLFVVTLTSNPEGRQVQGATVADGRSVAALILDRIREENAGATPLGSFGAVVGATIAPPAESLDIDGPLLAPGVGAQGGDPASVRRVFRGVEDRVLPSSSREVLSAGPDPKALRSAALATAQSFAWLHA